MSYLKLKKHTFLTTIFLFFCFLTQAQTTVVNSLQELLPYLEDSNVDVKLSPGIYWVTENNTNLFTKETDVVGRLSISLLLFEGNNSTYDFTDVTINVETAVFKAYGSNHQVYEVHTIGNNNVVKNLTLVDVGSVHDNPLKGANSIVMDGQGNRIEGFHVTTKGSYPYGYGDSFGKGGTNNIIRHKKHSACLIRGESNHVKNCSFIHRSYGHCIYTQAASNPTIEGCYVEGEVRTTDDMLAEEGTGSPADNVNFMTTWGYKLPSGYMMSTGEAGIRAYNAGETIINGIEYERGTSNPTVLDCTVKNMRTGVTLTHATGTKTVKRVTVKGCEQGFAIGSGTVEDCYADAAYGPVYQSTYNNDKNFHAEITVIAPENGYYNGSKSLAYMGGDNHNITLHMDDDAVNPDLFIQMGGLHENIRFLNDNLPSQNNHTARNINLINKTGYPILLPSDSYSNTIETCGAVSNMGTNNTISNTDACNFVFKFNPDLTKKYYIDIPKHNLRIGATGEADQPYTTATTTQGTEVEWKFVEKENGSLSVELASGGSKSKLGSNNTINAAMVPASQNDSATHFDIVQTNEYGVYTLTTTNDSSDYTRLQVDNNGTINMVASSKQGTWESFVFTETASPKIVHITKRNAPEYAMDADVSATDLKNVYLWSANIESTNQQWIETSTRDGYYTYQRIHTDLCLDAGDGGENKQNVYLSILEDNNYNQHWQKLSMGDGGFQLIKRNAPGFAIDGGSNGTNGKNIGLYDSSNTSQNLQWYITEIGEYTAPSLSVDDLEIKQKTATIYPNPVPHGETANLELNASITNKNLSVNIFNTTGQLINTINFKRTTKLAVETNNLSSGIYFVQLLNSTTLLSTHKLVIR